MNSLAPIFLASLSLLLGGACLSFPDAATPDDGGVDASVIDGSIDASVIDASVTDAPLTDAPPLLDAMPDAGIGLVGHTYNATPNVANTTLINGNHELHFTASNGFLIDSLVLAADSSAQNLMYSGGINERYAGIHAWESSSFQWADTTPTFTLLARGEAVFRFQLESLDGQLSVTSIYTIYPDGRIHRDEDATITAAGSLAAYLALNPASFTSVASSYVATPVTISVPIMGIQQVHRETVPEPGWGCVYGAELMMGMAHQIGTTVPESDQVRVTASSMGGNGTDPLLALIYDWSAFGSDDDALVGTSYTGNFIMAGGMVGTTGNECQRIEDLESWLLDRPSDLDLIGGTLAEPGEGDDDSDGYNEGGGFWALRSNDGSSLAATINTLSGNRIAPERAAFRLHGLTLPQNQVPVVTLNGEPQTHGQDFLWQGEVFGGVPADIVHWVYFGKALVQGDALVFSAN